MTLCDLPIKTFHTSQRNQIYSEASSTHFSAINLSYFTLYSSKCSLFQIHHYISENNQSYRRTQFNLTLCDLPIKTLLTSQRNQIYSEASSKHFSSNNLSYFTLYSSKCSLFQIHHYISENYQTSREHSLIWHFRLTIKTLLASQRNQIYSEAFKTHFIAINLSYFTLYPSYSLLIQINIQTFQYTIRLIADTIQFNTLRFTNQNTSHLPTQSNIFWSIFNTLFI